jgi:CelD/BcsL family acetyltransferase involved in cellulose biosynthesis
MLEQGLLRLHTLRLGGQAAAAFYGFATPTRWVYYLGGFAPGFERYSPGTLAVGHAVERAIQAGAQSFDFLRGGEAYKYAWGALDEPLHAHTLQPPAREVGRAA